MRIVFFLSFLTFGFSLFAQKAQQAIATLYNKYPQEKIVLSFSKNEYIAGETIFFKANVLTGYEPSQISTNLYVELYDKKKSIIARDIIPLLQGSGDGGFVLPASLAEDVYYIRAYTTYMLNFDEDYQYIKPINIYNPASMYKLIKKTVQWSALAFPEGGILLDDVAAAVAIRLFSNGRLPVSWQGFLHEKATNEIVANIEVLNNEIGIVRFIPAAGKEYVAVIKDDLGTTKTIDLPEVTKSGVSLQLRVADNKVGYAVYTKNISSNSIGYKLIGTIHDQPVFLATIKKSSGIISGNIDVSTLQSGIMRLTLFDENEKHLTERLCFIHHEIKKNVPAVSTDTLSFGAKAANSWQVEADSTSWPTYAVQVYDANYPIINNFLGDLYLTSDLSTPIHNAHWYLNDVNDKKAAALDALLITERWNRFDWNDLMNNKFPVIQFIPEKYLSYTAIVRKAKKPQRLRDVNLVFQAKDSSIQFVQVKTDSTGKFKMNNIMFVDSVKVYYQANNRKFLEREVTIDFELHNEFHPYKTNFPSSSFDVAIRTKNDSIPSHIKWAVAQRTNELVSKERAKMMEEVIIRTKAKTATEELNEKLSSGLYSSENTMIFDFINEEPISAFAYSNILQWLQGRVPGFSIEVRDGQTTPYLRNGVADIYVDELRKEPDILNDFSVNDIAMIKVIRGASLASRGGYGAILIYTKRGGMGPKFSTPALANNILTGYSNPPSFFSPVYSNEENRNIIDQREILFRSTLVYPSDAGVKSLVKFYNNDAAKRYRVVITGFTGNGRLVYLDRIIE